MRDVVSIECELAANGDMIRIRRKLDLREPAQSRANGKPIAVLWDRFLQRGNDLGTLGSGPNQAHLAAKHVPELRKLIQMRVAQDSADGCNARIAGLRPDG